MLYVLVGLEEFYLHLRAIMHIFSEMNSIKPILNEYLI